jgi:uncharacterized damage-inducible protein DinB
LPVRKLDGLDDNLIMTEMERIADQLQRAFVGEAWHGPSVMAILEGVIAQQAAARPLTGAHSIWELVLHIEAWVRAGRIRLEGQPAQLSDDEDWPKVTDTSEPAWERTKVALRQSYEELYAAISALDETRLDQPIVAGMSSVYITLHGVIQHSLYHAGQIAILKRADAK